MNISIFNKLEKVTCWAIHYEFFQYLFQSVGSRYYHNYHKSKERKIILPLFYNSYEQINFFIFRLDQKFSFN